MKVLTALTQAAASDNPKGIGNSAIPSNSPRQVKSVITPNPFLIMFNRSNYIFTFHICSYEGKKIQIPEYTEGWLKKKKIGNMSIFKPCLKGNMMQSPTFPPPWAQVRTAGGCEWRVKALQVLEHCAGCLGDICTTSCTWLSDKDRNRKAAIPDNMLAPAFPRTTEAHL